MNDRCFFVSDLHGKKEQYGKLFSRVEKERPAAVFLGGDLLPAGLQYQTDSPSAVPSFFCDFLAPALERLKKNLGTAYPKIFLIPGNDDPRALEPLMQMYETAHLWKYAHGKVLEFNDAFVYGYACVPPTPFLLKDWERYDVSRYVDPGCVPPTEGFRTVTPAEDIEFATIRQDLEELVAGKSLEKAIFLFHSPPYQTWLDRAALDGVMIDHVPADVHVGSIAIRELIEKRQPLLTLHGHIHESSRITGHWKQRIGRTWALSAAWEGPALALVVFRLSCPGSAERLLL